MALIATTQTQLDDAPFEPARFTVAKYHELIACGAFSEDDAVELLEGVVVPKMPKSPAHEVATRKTDRRLSSVVLKGWSVWNQAAVTLPESEPEPDVSIARGTLESYGDRHPAGRDLGMVGEVAETSLARDRRKARVYARARIPFYWIINLIERCVEVHSDPVSRGRQSRYRNVTVYHENERVPLILDGVEIDVVAVRDLIP